MIITMKRMVLILMAVLLALAVGAALAEEPAGAVAEEYAEVPAEPVDVTAEVPAIGPAQEPANSFVAESANSAAQDPAAEAIPVVSVYGSPPGERLKIHRGEAPRWYIWEKLYRHSARSPAQPNTNSLHEIVTIVKGMKQLPG